ncbi:Vegetative incompatibility protein HET-E-1 [Colletotrichum siamense]|nr:Vegetative incompatibility protein HET-E-1 [Colletotrichum siamense]
MWLINVTNIHTLRLEEFLGDPPSAYAILSHTWGADEITFDKFNALAAAASQLHGRSQVDINDDTYRSAGFAKIRDAAILAKRQGFVHLWVDTCCINKASSAELSESINSMYLWYQRATICYAYLPDVDPGSSTIEQEGSQFRNSRWFTRGWTLQELIAPRVVEFYASDWSILGTKKAGSGSFCEVLSSITGIYPDVLAGTMVLSQVSVADKMRWASTRQTKRAEDIAYCLLGLFNVNMPLLYGEGSRAFIRLQEEILRETDDQSLFLWRLNSVQPKTQGPETDNTLHGLLAGSPNAFAGLGIHHVRPLQPLESEENEPASMTSKGLKTNMVLVHTEGPHYYALLDCTVWRSQSPTLRENVCIFLKHLWGNQFARTADKDSSGVDFVTNDSKGLQYHTETKLIYVKQQPFYVY